ncbi:amidohydrolase [Pectinatus frisingensis]|jgi:aminobenzoyl-glutamate utilization protein A|uniref:amidohydrolase n=1 Tax=Pectinatus frisingensis TaxID=865 RepID=UPI0015F61A21|nr:amidohydrolase [Pectinatus frisingensis]
MRLCKQIVKMADAMQPQLVERRRDIHRHPEPGWTEFRTASLVADELTRLGYTVKTGEAAIKKSAMMGVPDETILKAAQKRAVDQGADKTWVEKMSGGLTGIIGTMNFSNNGPVVALRFDMDSNDVSETQNEQHRPYREGFCSINPNAMHACGHDGHTTVGLAVAGILSSLKDELKGTIKLIFQPAEEGVRGARAMVENGDVDDVNYMLGAHFGFKMRKTGSIACNVKGFLATSKYDAYFTGVPAHAGAAPETGKNALLAAACATLNLHAISRHSEGVSRINVGTLEAGSGRNIIGDKALIKLETRGGSSNINKYMETEAQRILKAAAQMYDVKIQIEKVGGAAGANNTPELAKYIHSQAEELGIFNNIVDDCDFGASEDFSYFMERVQENGGQAAYVMVGADLAAGHHDSHFDFDEKALGYSVKALTCTAAGLLLGDNK